MHIVEAGSLKNIKLFEGLSADALSSIEQDCKWYQCNINEQLIDRHSTDLDLYFLVSGKARVVNYSLTGREVSFDDKGPGDYFGELGAIDGQPRSANVIALEDMLVARLSRSDFIELISQQPSITLKILHGLAKIVRISNNRIMDLSTVGANNRVHAEILRLVELGEVSENTAVVRPIPIHGDIASRVSTTRETVNRVFSDLTRKGLIKRNKNELLVLDISRLKRMVELVRGETGDNEI
jgi:CRP/FNR family cyclic AMP-dependent transcriptional regulator|tara:strand:+ start:2789 stop:3505 length:717 start_codon:yes stop_codon:yes gene_type:complete